MHRESKDANLPAVAKEILGYYLRHPHAADTLTELARWRLVEEAVRQSVETTEAALQWLIAEGYVREEIRMGTERIYQFIPERRNDAESLLRKELQNQDSSS